jgi:hypothetical protein
MTAPPEQGFPGRVVHGDHHLPGRDLGSLAASGAARGDVLMIPL